MRLIPFLALRYLFKKKSSQAIHLITGISILGITVGTAALIIVLSVFNGFESLLTGMFSKYNPDIKIVSSRGTTFQEDSLLFKRMHEVEGVKVIARSLDITGMMQYEEYQDFGIVRGIDSTYASVISLGESILDGDIRIFRTSEDFALLGLGLASKLSVSLENFLNNFYVYTPTTESAENIAASPKDSYGKHAVTPIGIFSLHQETDNQLCMVPLETLRAWTGRDGALSAYEIKLFPDVNSKQLIAELERLTGDQYLVKDRYRQDEAFLKIMNLEKWLFYLLFSLTLILVSFTILGALWMIVLEKRLDISILKSMGMMNSRIQWTFMLVGLGIGMIGLLSGFAMALGFYALQTQYALIEVPDEFVIDAYPIALKAWDFVTVSITVMGICVLACLLPVAKIQEIPAIYREE